MGTKRRRFKNQGGNMRKQRTILTMMVIFAMLPINIFAAEEPIIKHTGEEFPAAVNGVITLDGSKEYGDYPGVITIKEGVTIEGNGAKILSNISITTDKLVTIKDVHVNPTLVEGEGSSSRKNGIGITGTKDAENNTHTFNVVIDNVVFGNENDKIPAYRSIANAETMPSKDSSLIVTNSIFYGARYNVNLLDSDKIHFEGNTFVNPFGPAIQYTVTEKNKENISIINNSFTGKNYGLNVTVSGDSFASEDANIGNNIKGNTFDMEGYPINIAVSDKAIEKLTVPYQPGVFHDTISFSSFSRNELYKPAKTGPLSEDLIDNLIYKYPVTFVGHDDVVIETMHVNHREDATAPEAPKVEGYTFSKWDTDFSKVVTDLTVKAVYEVNTYTVTFKGHDGKTIDTVEVDYGKAATAPEAPKVEGYTFSKWDTDFSKVVTDLTVKAVYTKAVDPVDPVEPAEPVAPVVTVEAEGPKGVEVDGLDSVTELTEEEIALGAYIELAIGAKNLKDLSAVEKELLETYFKDVLKDDSPLAYVLDISIFKVVGDDSTRISELDKEIMISFVVPSDFLKIDFDLLRIHDGKVEKLDYTYDKATGVVTFKTDRLSTYVLAATEETLPGTGVEHNAILPVSFLAAGMVLVLVGMKRRREN